MVLRHRQFLYSPRCAFAAAALAASAQVVSVPQIAQLLRTRQYEQALRARDALLQDTAPRLPSALSAGHGAERPRSAPARLCTHSSRRCKSCPSDLLPLEGAAQIEYARRQPDAAELLSRILAIRPDDVTSHAMLATLDRAKRDCRAALPHYEASRALFASHPELPQGYAYCLAADRGQRARRRGVSPASPRPSR